MRPALYFLLGPVSVRDPFNESIIDFIEVPRVFQADHNALSLNLDICEIASVEHGANVVNVLPWPLNLSVCEFFGGLRPVRVVGELAESVADVVEPVLLLPD